MIDLKLTSDGDLDISDVGDVSLTNSIRQAVLIRLRWIFAEWRLGPSFGFPWFEEVFRKNPNLTKIRSLIRDEIMGVEGVQDAEVYSVTYSREHRMALFKFFVTIGGERFKEEVALYE